MTAGTSLYDSLLLSSEKSHYVSLYLIQMARTDFGKRLKLAFGNASNQEIARKLGLSAPAIQNYVSGRVPDGDKLLQIAEVTKCDLHWLLTGEGEREFGQRAVDLNEAIRDIIRETVREELESLRPKKRLVLPLELSDKKARKAG